MDYRQSAHARSKFRACAEFPVSFIILRFLGRRDHRGASEIAGPMSCKAVGFANQRSRRRYMSLDGIRADTRHHCRRSSDRMRPHQRRYNERVSPLRSMPDRGRDAAASGSQMRTSTTITSLPVSARRFASGSGPRPTNSIPATVLLEERGIFTPIIVYFLLLNTATVI